MRKNLGPPTILIYIILLHLIISGCRNNNQKKNNPQPIPHFNITLIDNKKIFNTKDIPTGKPVVFFYFGTYCEHSRKVMKSIIKNMDMLKNIRFYLVTNDPFPDLIHFYKNFKLNEYPNITIGNDKDLYFFSKLHILSYPYIEVFGSDGKLNNTYKGEVYGRTIMKSALGKIDP